MKVKLQNDEDTLNKNETNANSLRQNWDDLSKFIKMCYNQHIFILLTFWEKIKQYLEIYKLYCYEWKLHMKILNLEDKKNTIKPKSPVPTDLNCAVISNDTEQIE